MSAILDLIEMNFEISKKQLFHKIKDKQDGLYPTVHVKSPLFFVYAEETFFLLCGKEKENISEQDSQNIQVFLGDFVKRSRAFWKESTVKSDPQRMFKNHTEYWEKMHDFGELNPPEQQIVIVEAANDPPIVPDPPPNVQVGKLHTCVASTTWGYICTMYIRGCQRCNFVLQSALNCLKLKWKLAEHVG